MIVSLGKLLFLSMLQLSSAQNIAETEEQVEYPEQERVYYDELQATECRHQCIDDDMVFCPDPDYKAGYCCESAFGCNLQFPQHSFLCSDSAQNEVQKYFSCPVNPECGQTRILNATDTLQIQFIARNDSSLFFEEICSYELLAEDWKPGDLIEISQVDSHSSQIDIFNGGFSMTTSQTRTILESKTDYRLAGEHRVYMVVQITQLTDDLVNNRPYFSFQYKKVQGTVPAEQEEVITVVDDGRWGYLLSMRTKENLLKAIVVVAAMAAIVCCVLCCFNICCRKLMKRSFVVQKRLQEQYKDKIKKDGEAEEAAGAPADVTVGQDAILNTRVKPAPVQESSHRRTLSNDVIDLDKVDREAQLVLAADPITKLKTRVLQETEKIERELFNENKEFMKNIIVANKRLDKIEKDFLGAEEGTQRTYRNYDTDQKLMTDRPMLNLADANSPSLQQKSSRKAVVAPTPPSRREKDSGRKSSMKAVVAPTPPSRREKDTGRVVLEKKTSTEKRLSSAKVTERQPIADVLKEKDVGMLSHRDQRKQVDMYSEHFSDEDFSAQIYEDPDEFYQGDQKIIPTIEEQFAEFKRQEREQEEESARREALHRQSTSQQKTPHSSHRSQRDSQRETYRKDSDGLLHSTRKDQAQITIPKEDDNTLLTGRNLLSRAANESVSKQVETQVKFGAEVGDGTNRSSGPQSKKKKKKKKKVSKVIYLENARESGLL